MQNVKGRVKEDVDIVIDKNETRVVNGTSTLNIVDDYAITSLKSIDLIASDHLSTTTISGIMSYKSGGKLNMKSANDMTIKAETTFTGTSTGVGTLTFSGTGSEVTAKIVVEQILLLQHMFILNLILVQMLLHKATHWRQWHRRYVWQILKHQT